MSKGMLRLVEAFGYGWTDLARLTINAMESAFIPFDERLADPCALCQTGSSNSTRRAETVTARLAIARLFQ